MDAQLARKIAERANDNKTAKQYGIISAAIDKTAKEGNFEYMYFDVLTPGVKKILEDDGFTVKIVYDQRDGNHTSISW